MAGKLPFDAELMKAKQRRFNETVVFVHHFGGSRRTVLRHVRLVHDLGFDAIRFDLIFNKAAQGDRLPITGDLNWGVRHVWANQIESILNALPGRKILFAFSMPAASALQAVARRHGGDIAGLVCDSGPFLQISRCTWNLYREQYQVRSRILRAGYTGLSMLLWGLGFEEQIKKTLAGIHRGFPVLSIRGWQDSLVPPNAIDELFNLQDHLDLEVLSLPEAGHLTGLRDFPQEYTARVKKFLNHISTDLSTPRQTATRDGQAPNIV